MTGADRLNVLLMLAWGGLGGWWLHRYRQPAGDTTANLMLVMLAGLMMAWNILQLWRRRLVRTIKRR